MTYGVSNEPVIASTPTPLSVEPRVAAPAETAEISRQAEEAKVKAAEPAKEVKVEPKEDKPKLSTREAIRAAAAKVNAEPATPLKTEPKSAEPAPAAAVVKDAKTAEPVKADAKAAEPAAAVTRGEDGKFVSSKPADPAPATEAKTAEPTKVAEPVAKAPALPSHTAEPAPKRFSADAKEEWASLPEKSRAEVARMERELTAGFEKNRAAAERDSSIAEFHEMAAKGNTTVKEALTNFTNLENALRSPATRDKGLEALFQNIGLSPREWAAKLLGQTPDAAASQQDATVAELRAELAELKKGLGTLTTERQAAQTNTTHEAVTKFAADNPRFEELSDDIAFFLKSGRTKDLAEAYKLAERLNPAPAAAVAPAPEPAPASSAPAVPTRPTLVSPAPSSDAGTRSIAGTPTAGSDPVRKQPSNSIKEAIRRAAAAAG